MTDDTELEDLLALVESPGFQRFRQWANDEFGSKAYRAKAQTIIREHSKAGTVDQAGMHLLQLESSQLAIEGLFNRLEDRIKRLRNQAVPQ